MSAAESKTPPEVLADQLRKPSGRLGNIVANNMNKSNKIMTEFTYRIVNAKQGERILEIGFGNGKLLSSLLHEKNIFLAGIDFSQLMVSEAKQHLIKYIKEGKLELKEADMQAIPYPNNTFDKACTINTIYFWDNPIKNAIEAYRVLKPGGSLHICFRPKEQIKAYPFTKYNFELYEREDVVKILQNSGFKNISMKRIQLPDITLKGKTHFMFAVCLSGTKPTYIFNTE